MLTNHYLLKLIEKGTNKALRNVNNLDLQQELEGYEFHIKNLYEVGIHQSFQWIRPETSINTFTSWRCTPNGTSSKWTKTGRRLKNKK